MPLHHVVLSLLADGPSHGYELKGAFEDAVGPQWGQLNIGHLYQLLDRLSRDGLATTHRESQTVKPDRVVYELTDDGYAELSRWLGTPAPRAGGYRDEFFLKVVAAVRTGDRGVLDEVLSTQRRHLMTETHHLAALEREHRDDPVVSLLIKNARLHVEADLKLVESAEDSLPATLRKPATRHTPASVTTTAKARAAR
ncbi:PadR family transcriptional regulator [Knoellia koreensis]|uniref:Helix-turn-helix transcriptional regulator n=1 Tax=Knoellia koreensis TaxID=2730921 RepID=A0A849HHW7_9MICO|nr:PadR family transcriptional regulator [Knoellia sp. DB2414S]NNM45871.1 helix-turn-helix transcriptional regulator [Knoellia sp. DB2414S]